MLPKFGKTDKINSYYLGHVNTSFMYSWLEISKDALVHNINQYKKIIHNNKLALIIKGNAYGHGQLPIAQIADQNKEVDWLCVSHLSDAILLRQNKIKKQILVLSCIDIDPAMAAHQEIAIVVGSYATVERLNAIGKQHNCFFKVHIKVDTGLSRLGIAVEDIHAFINYVLTLPHIIVDGILSHFAQSQHEDQSFTQKQLVQFNIILKKFTETNIFIPNRHISNSAATTIEQPLCNFFRLGIGMYGYWSSEVSRLKALKKYSGMVLKPILTWKTRISEIKNIPTGVSVGYNCTYQTTRPITMAILPIGYYDGYQLRFSNRAWVRIKDNYAPVIGRVCMNMTLVDISDIPTVNVGDEVVLLGDFVKINANTLAAYAHLDNVREVLIAINSHLPRLII
ncbi:MAG: alanine racemase [Candidatus Babeliales bacterium]|jgi:alanine racemase